MHQTWGIVNSSITLSNGNLTATLGSGGGTNHIGYGSGFFTMGKYYWETITTSTAIASTQIGISASGAATTDGIFLGQLAAHLGYVGNGSVFNNNGGAPGSPVQAYASGNVICHALDFTTSQIWWRVGISGNWNNSVGFDPATNVGGFAIPAAVFAAGPVGPAFNLNTSSPNDSVQAFFASSSWAGVAPNGFISFNDFEVAAWLFRA